MTLPYKRIVIKIGTSTITGGTSHIDQPVLIELVRQISWIQDQGVDVALVSSGAVAAGLEALNFPHFSKHIPRKQMLAAIGQPRLMAIYNKIFRMYGHNTAQILMTRNDFVQRANYLNARNTLDGLLYQNVIPIINENDTVSINELKMGDNDTMSAMVCGLIGADLLILATDQDGLFTANPAEVHDAKLIDCIDTTEIPDEIWKAAGGSISGLGTGGMSTKVHAADIARRMGASVLVVNGSLPNILIQAASGTRVGTIFKPVNTFLESRKRYLLTEFRSKENCIVMDDGAAKAIVSGKSLLPAGVKRVDGNFERGDTVRMTDLAGHEMGIGTSNYTSTDLTRIAGMKASEIEAILGYTFGDEVVHHDFMILN